MQVYLQTSSLIKHILQVALQSGTGAILYVKKDFKVSKILKSTVFDKSFKKCYVLALNIQSTLNLKEIRQDKTNETQVKK